MEKCTLILIGLICFSAYASGQGIGQLQRMMVMRQRELALRRAFPFGIGGIRGGIPPPAARLAIEAQRRAALLGIGSTGPELPFGFGSTFVGAPLNFGVTTFGQPPFFGNGFSSFGPTLGQPFGFPSTFAPSGTFEFPSGFGATDGSVTFGEITAEGPVTSGGGDTVNAQGGDASGAGGFGQTGTQPLEFIESRPNNIEPVRAQSGRNGQRPPTRDRPPEGEGAQRGRGPLFPIPRRMPSENGAPPPFARIGNRGRQPPVPSFRPGAFNRGQERPPFPQNPRRTSQRVSGGLNPRLPPVRPPPGIAPSPSPPRPRLLRPEDVQRRPGPPRPPFPLLPRNRPPGPPPPPFPPRLRRQRRPPGRPLSVRGRGRNESRGRRGNQRQSEPVRQQRRERQSPPAFPNVPEFPQIPAVTPPGQQIVNPGVDGNSGPGFMFPQQGAGVGAGASGGFQFPTTPGFSGSATGGSIFPAQSTQGPVFRQQGPGFTSDTTIFSGSFDTGNAQSMPGAPNGPMTPFSQGSLQAGQMTPSMTSAAFPPQGFPGGPLAFPGITPPFGRSDQMFFPGGGPATFGGAGGAATFGGTGGVAPTFGGAAFQPGFRTGQGSQRFPTGAPGGMFDPRFAGFGFGGQGSTSTGVAGPEFTTTNAGQQQPDFNLNFQPLNPGQSIPPVDSSTFATGSTEFSNTNTFTNAGAGMTFDSSATNTFDNTGTLQFGGSTSGQTGGVNNMVTTSIVERNVNDVNTNLNQGSTITSGVAESGASQTGNEFRVVEVGNILDTSGAQGSTGMTEMVTTNIDGGAAFQPSNNANSAFSTFTINTNEPVVDLSANTVGAIDAATGNVVGGSAGGSSTTVTRTTSTSGSSDRGALSAAGTGSSNTGSGSTRTKTVVTTRTVSRNAAPFPGVAGQQDFSFFVDNNAPEVMPPISLEDSQNAAVTSTTSGTESSSTGGKTVSGGTRTQTDEPAITSSDGFETIFTEFFGTDTAPKIVQLSEAPPVTESPSSGNSSETITFRVTGNGATPNIADITSGGQAGGFNFVTSNTGTPGTSTVRRTERTVVESSGSSGGGFTNMDIPPPDLVGGNQFP